MISLKTLFFRISGILLILLGIALCVYLIAGQYQHCAEIWNTTYKAQEYASALEYFFAVSKGAIFIGIAVGCIPVLAGSLLLVNAHK